MFLTGKIIILAASLAEPTSGAGIRARIIPVFVPTCSLLAPLASPAGDCKAIGVPSLRSAWRQNGNRPRHFDRTPRQNENRVRQIEGAARQNARHLAARSGQETAALIATATRLGFASGHTPHYSRRRHGARARRVRWARHFASLKLGGSELRRVAPLARRLRPAGVGAVGKRPSLKRGGCEQRRTCAFDAAFRQTLIRGTSPPTQRQASPKTSLPSSNALKSGRRPRPR